MSRKNRKILSDTIIIFCMTIVCVAFLMPYAWMLINSIKPRAEILKAKNFWPQKPTWDNYITVFKEAPMLAWFKNSVFVTVVGTLIVLFTSSIAGFVFAKYEFKGKNFWFIFILATMMVPAQVTMIPSFMLIDKLHLYDSLWSLIIPGMVMGTGIFMCRQFAEDIPTALCEAATIDGASDFYVYSRIILPLIRPALGALTIFTFLAKWNDFLGPLLYLGSTKKMTLPLALNFFTGRKTSDVGAVMAAAALVMLPVTIVYLAMQKQFVKGIAITGMK